MKKILFVFAALALLLAGCTTTQASGGYPAGTVVSAADYPAGMGGTRARISGLARSNRLRPTLSVLWCW